MLYAEDLNMKTMKLVLDKTYYVKNVVKDYIRHQSGHAVMYSENDLSGEYQYIGKKGHKFHFFSNAIGKDVYIEKDKLDEMVSCI